MQEEIWKDVPSYEGLYQVSNLGRVKSLNRFVTRGCNSMFKKGNVLKSGVNGAGYYYVNLINNKKSKNFRVHQLVSIVFLNHTPCGYSLVVDHINNDKLDNRVENLQIITHRQNCHKRLINSTSKYVGVHYAKNRNKWKSNITIKGKKVSLGSFNCELAAHLAYENKLKQII